MNKILDKLASAVLKLNLTGNGPKLNRGGDIRAMIVSGPPGVGKSFGVEQVIEKAVLFDKIAGKRLRAEVVKGSATANGP